ncbi:hypothetical protein Rpal_3332 [Rhodopseudomonas palustris TIE-1]|uniref:hypothetical protein n=1 Tax=Rhodopseudomonas palustris TaxID=1076 RepID=UPI000164A952|nr:hypothetical protein [Rhodopseudomonas palustris]ACF01834.1 hypothetical protein Rpal_3332 [Rhodopseudomonas palustris TIE-1]
MAKKQFDNVRHAIATTGPGDITLGTVPEGWQSFSAAGAVAGDQPEYEITDGGAREIGTLTLGSDAATATRSVSYSTNSNNPLNLSGGAVLTCVMTARAFNDDVLSVSRSQGLSSSGKTQGLNNLGASVVGKALFSAADQAAAQTAVGATSVGKGLLTAPSPAEAVKLLPIPGLIFGLTLSTAGSSATFNVATGVAASRDSTDMMTLGSPLNKTTSAWAVGTGNGALDTGPIANNTWYHVHLIKRADTGVVDVLISLSATSPTLPASYTLSRRIGAIKTNGSAQWVGFTQIGDEFLWSVAVQDASNTTFSSTALLQTLSVPPGIKVSAKVTVEYGVASLVWCFISSPDQADIAASSSNFTIVGTVGNTNPTFNNYVYTDASARIRIRTDSPTAGYVMTHGWRDPRL